MSKMDRNSSEQRLCDSAGNGQNFNGSNSDPIEQINRQSRKEHVSREEVGIEKENIPPSELNVEQKEEQIAAETLLSFSNQSIPLALSSDEEQKERLSIAQWLTSVGNSGLEDNQTFSNASTSSSISVCETVAEKERKPTVTLQNLVEDIAEMYDDDCDDYDDENEDAESDYEIFEEFDGDQISSGNVSSSDRRRPRKSAKQERYRKKRQANKPYAINSFPTYCSERFSLRNSPLVDGMDVIIRKTSLGNSYTIKPQKSCSSGLNLDDLAPSEENSTSGSSEKSSSSSDTSQTSSCGSESTSQSDFEDTLDYDDYAFNRTRLDHKLLLGIYNECADGGKFSELERMRLLRCLARGELDIQKTLKRQVLKMDSNFSYDKDFKSLLVKVFKIFRKIIGLHMFQSDLVSRNESSLRTYMNRVLHMTFYPAVASRQLQLQEKGEHQFPIVLCWKKVKSYGVFEEAIRILENVWEDVLSFSDW